MTDIPGAASEPLPRPTLPADRYGRPPRHRTRRQLAPFVAVGVVLIVAGAGAGARYWSHRTTGEMVSYETSDSGVTITVAVRRDPDRTTECALRARNRDGVEVGRRTLVIPPGKGRKVALTETLATRERPITGEIQSCHSVAGE